MDELLIDIIENPDYDQYLEDIDEWDIWGEFQEPVNDIEPYFYEV